MTAGVFCCPVPVGDRALCAGFEADGARVLGPDALFPLRVAVETGWRLFGARGMMKRLAIRDGHVAEGIAGWVTARDDPEEVDAGTVRVTFNNDDIVVTEERFAAVVLRLAQAAVETRADQFSPRALWWWARRLRLLHNIRVPRGTGRRFEARFAMDITDEMTDARTARLLSNGRDGRLIVFDQAFGGILTDAVCQPSIRKHGAPVSDGPATGDPVGEVLMPFTEAALRHLIAEGLAPHRLRGEWVEAP